MLCMNLNPLTASRTVFFVACLMSVASASWSMDLLQAYEAAKKHDATLRVARAAAGSTRVLQRLRDL